MPAMPKISVVTPTFNSRHTLRETLQSVVEQAYPNLEHLVMDGGSIDGTLDILKIYPHLTWVSQKDEGHYDAMNKGILKATGDVVSVLNSDDCYRPGALKAVGGAFTEHPEWDGLFGDVVYVDGQSKEIFRRQEAKWDYDVLRYGAVYVIHPTLFVRRSLHDRLGFFRHKEFLNCSDYDFLLRMGRANCRIGHIRQFLVNYRFHQHGQSADLRIVRNTRREADILRREHGLPAGLLGRAYHYWYRLVRQGQKLRYLGKCDLIPGGLILRKHVQAKTDFSSNIGLDKL
jgi:glycosyltransferase involved in cell wall biosynthesis